MERGELRGWGENIAPMEWRVNGGAMPGVCTQSSYWVKLRVHYAIVHEVPPRWAIESLDRVGTGVNENGPCEIAPASCTRVQAIAGDCKHLGLGLWGEARDEIEAVPQKAKRRHGAGRNLEQAIQR